MPERHKRKSLGDVTLVDLPEMRDAREGALAFVEFDRHVPFAVPRIFYLYELPQGARRGEHAHRTLEQLLICIAGSIEVTTENRLGRRRFILETRRQGLYVPPMTWLALSAREAGTICLVLASEHFDEADYIRSYAYFEEILRGGPGYTHDRG